MATARRRPKKEATSTAPLAEQQLEKIIARDMPGYKLARRHLVDERRPEPDEAAPDINALRKKYLGDSFSFADNAESEVEQPQDAGDVIVAVEPAEGSDDQIRPKTVVISGKSKRVIGRQG
jgi:hypothetical protein